MRIITTLYFLVLLGKEISIAQSVSHNDTARLTIKDESKYSQHFLEMLKSFARNLGGDRRLELNDNSIRMSSQNNKYDNYSTTLPSLPQRGKWYTLVGEKDGVLYELKLFQKGNGEVEYEILLKRGLEIVFRRNAIADVSPSFLIAGEGYEDEKTGRGYTVNAYLSSTDLCETWFSIGNTEDGLKGIINEIPCENGAVIEIIGKHPTLREVK